MQNYSKLEISNFEQKDKRISFLSIFSSLTQNDGLFKYSVKSLFEEAIELTDKLYEKYPNFKDDIEKRNAEIKKAYEKQPEIKSSFKSKEEEDEFWRKEADANRVMDEKRGG